MGCGTERPRMAGDARGAVKLAVTLVTTATGSGAQTRTNRTVTLKR